jgi:2-oxoglutarate dehydrogenase E2 component (dihydrolipoamide succinyltransferase)
MTTIEIKVPVLPESVADATIVAWYKKVGEAIKRDERLVDIETDKVILEVVAPEEGRLESILKPEGSIVTAEEAIAVFKLSNTLAEKMETPTALPAKTDQNKKVRDATLSKSFPKPVDNQEKKRAEQQTDVLSPTQRRQLQTTSKEEQIKTKTDEKLISRQPSPVVKKSGSEQILTFPEGDRVEQRVPMTRLRARIAERLIEAQQTAAILTTFNEVNMQPIMSLRQKYKDIFEKTYGVRLGFMSFFTMTVVEALKNFPIINASIEGNDIVYHGYYDIGIAVSSKRGLVVPVIRNAEMLSMSEIEKKVTEYSEKAQNGQLDISDITGGTFTISNGGVFGSLMSTPILNPPQSAILGMHKIQERVVVENGAMVIRPMMYVALSYDHRIIDGKDSVRFLVTVKELLEDPARLALGI